MRRPAPDGRPSGCTGQAVVEWIGAVVAVALVVGAVGVALRADVPRRAVETLRAAFGTSGAPAGVPQASAAALAYAQAAVTPGPTPGPSLLGARAMLRAELGAAEGTRTLERLLLERLRTDHPGWFDVQVLPIRGTSVRGIHLGAGLRTTVPTGEVVVHVVTPGEESDVTSGGRKDALRAWVLKNASDVLLTRATAVADEVLDPGSGPPRGVVGRIVPPLVGALAVVRTEADEGWPGLGESAGDALLCRPVSVHTAHDGAAGQVRPGVRIGIVRHGALLHDAVSTAATSCRRLEPSNARE
jgi:hypothetical protein